VVLNSFGTLIALSFSVVAICCVPITRTFGILTQRSFGTFPRRGRARHDPVDAPLKLALDEATKCKRSTLALVIAGGRS